jgi:vibriolysin
MTPRPIRLLAFGALAVCLTACESALPLADESARLDRQVAAHLAALPELSVDGVRESGLPASVHGPLRAGEGLEAVLPLFKLEAESLRLERAWVDELGMWHRRYRQVLDGQDVVGSHLTEHLLPDGRVASVNGNARGGEDVERAPRLSASAALEHARAALEDDRAALFEEGLVFVRASSDEALHLAYAIDAVGPHRAPPLDERLFIDASTGALVDRHPRVHAARNRRVHDAKGAEVLPGTLVVSEGGTPPAGDAVVGTFYGHLGAAYDYFSAVHGRDSFDGAGAALTATVHYGQRYNNAFWDGKQLVFGDGDGQLMRSLALSLDVVVHELAHAVTERTAGLVYQNQPGALNESMSDVFGASAQAWKLGVVDALTWKIGEDAWTPQVANDALRYMNNPIQDGASTDYFPERYMGTEDNGGVHLNSGIPNLAFYLMAQGGEHPRRKVAGVVTGIGVEKAQKVFYRALTQYMTSNTNFLEARAACKRAAEDLYDISVSGSVEHAWSLVGVGPIVRACKSGDGLCDEGCAVFDLDCHCKQDTVCDARCPDWTRDPDCPRDCAQNYICATQACPVPDPDCVPEGQRCGSAQQCKHRSCVSDSQHPRPYCSKGCLSAADCPSGMTCGPDSLCHYPLLPTKAPGEACAPGENFCTGGAECVAARDGENRCALPCTDDHDCQEGDHCLSQDENPNARFCQAGPEARRRIQGEGCTSAPGGTFAALWLAALATWRRRRPC